MRSIQNEDVKTLSDITGGGGTASQLINDTKIYDSTNSQQLSVSISTGALGTNRTLSNLNSPTSINQDLLPSGTKNLGSSTLIWSNAYLTQIKYGSTLSIDVQNRTLNDSAGTSAFDWSSTTVNNNKSKRLINVATPTGANDAANKTYVDTPPTIYDNGAVTTTLAVNWAVSQTQMATVFANCTITLSNPVVGETYLLKLVQDSAGLHSYAWAGGTFKWSGATAPSGSGSNKIDIITFFYDGTNYFGSFSLNY